MKLKRAPEMDMTLDQLSKNVEEKAEQKIKLLQELMQLDADIVTLVGIMTVKAMKELGDIPC